MFTWDLYDLCDMWDIWIIVNERSASEMVLNSRSLERQIEFEARCHTRMTGLCNIQVYHVLPSKSLESLDQFLGVDPN